MSAIGYYFASENSGCFYDPATQGCAIGPGCDTELGDCHPVSQATSTNPTATSSMLLPVIGSTVLLVLLIAIVVYRRKKKKQSQHK